MIPAIIGYLWAFGLAWAPVAARGFPWTLLLLVFPALWIAGVARSRPGAVAVGFLALIGLGVWATLSAAFYPALAAVALALVAWDAAGLSLWLRQADEIRDRTKVWQGLLLRSFGLAGAGAALALAFLQLELSLPFWVMTVLLLATWAAVAALRWGVAHRGSSDNHDGGDRGSR
ncbi:MAG: hypothetical protein IBX67_03795 [Dehalococcoidia bacterium]|nr:hypothetical protein [Dehalococcoidia bacterium]